jgi:hypothetical protein
VTLRECVNAREEGLYGDCFLFFFTSRPALRRCLLASLRSFAREAAVIVGVVAEALVCSRRDIGVLVSKSSAVFIL